MGRPAKTLYKVLGPNGEPVNGGKGAWFLPAGKRPGKWMPPIVGNLVACQNGYHLCALGQLPKWLNARVFVAEWRGDYVADTEKIVVRQARLVLETGWNEQKARLFACDCAEHVLPIFEKAYPNDARPRECTIIVRRFAEGKATSGELGTARAAAWAAARAAWAAARVAGDAAWAAGDAARAATWAAGDAARDVARATGAAAWAAGDAARDAARAAGAAAWAAAMDAGDVAWTAAMDAGDAERKWQAKRLRKYLSGS